MNICDETLNKSVDSVPYRLFIEILNEKVANQYRVYILFTAKKPISRENLIVSGLEGDQIFVCRILSFLLHYDMQLYKRSCQFLH